jgi:multidrug efflux pump subunit AcrA (membrane-fusion protein)
VIVETPGITQPLNDGTLRVRHPRRPLWRRRLVQLIGLGVLLLVVAVLAMSRLQPGPAAPVAPPVAAPLIAHGQILPAQQARVGTQGGGVVQRLAVNPGDQTAADAPLAWVTGPSGTEIVTAPFAGTVTNVLVHGGDTLMPGATIAVVADLHLLRVETTDVDEFLVSKVAVGQRVQVSVDALDNMSVTGVVTNVALLPQTGASGNAAYPVIISIGGVPPEVRAGMSVRVTLPDR